MLNAVHLKGSPASCQTMAEGPDVGRNQAGTMVGPFLKMMQKARLTSVTKSPILLTPIAKNHELDKCFPAPIGKKPVGEVFLNLSQSAHGGKNWGLRKMKSFKN